MKDIDIKEKKEKRNWFTDTIKFIIEDIIFDFIFLGFFRLIGAMFKGLFKWF